MDTECICFIICSINANHLNDAAAWSTPPWRKNIHVKSIVIVQVLQAVTPTGVSQLSGWRGIPYASHLFNCGPVLAALQTLILNTCVVVFGPISYLSHEIEAITWRSIIAGNITNYGAPIVGLKYRWWLYFFLILSSFGCLFLQCAIILGMMYVFHIRVS